MQSSVDATRMYITSALQLLQHLEEFEQVLVVLYCNDCSHFPITVVSFFLNPYHPSFSTRVHSDGIYCISHQLVTYLR